MGPNIEEKRTSEILKRKTTLHEKSHMKECVWFQLIVNSEVKNE